MTANDTIAAQVATMQAGRPPRAEGEPPNAFELDRARFIADFDSAVPLPVGSTLTDVDVLDVNGAATTLFAVLRNQTTVLVFYRGEWCPYCNIQLRALQAALPRFVELGASLVAISPQAADHSLSLAEKHELAFPVLSDLDQSVIRKYRVQFTLSGDLEDLQVNVFGNDPASQNADHSRSLPLAATYVLDRSGIVRYAFVPADWRIRAEPTDIEAALRSIAAGG